MSTGVVELRRGLVELSRMSLTVPLCEMPNTGTVCECAGLLAYVGELWLHGAWCVDCYGTDRPCSDTHRHIACVKPIPMICSHGGCRETVSLDIPCAHGQEPRSCCGCCWVTSDALEGRRMWPR